MADKTFAVYVNGLTAGTLADDDAFYFYDDSAANSKKVAFSSIAAAVAADAGVSGVSTGATAPASTPGNIGDIYVDTVTETIYIATNTVDSGGWKAIAL